MFRTLAVIALASTLLVAELPEAKKHTREIHYWDMFVARYSEIPQHYPPNFFRIYADGVVEKIIEDTWFDDKANFDLLKPLPAPLAKDEIDRIEELNNSVNHVFEYYSGPFNYWYSEPPSLALALGIGDCKAYAAYKYHMLKQMGYKNVKIISVVIPDGRGDLGGHVIVLLNDVWVLDINWPYFYTFEILRERSGLEQAFFPDGTIWNVQ